MAAPAISQKAIALSALSGDNLRYGLELHKKGYPILAKYASQKGVRTIELLEEWYTEKKRVLKYIAALEEVRDVGDYERFFEMANWKNLVMLLGYDRVVPLMRMMKDNDVSLHNWTSNLPTIKPDDDAAELMEFFKRTMKYNYATQMEVLGFLNYKKVRTATNIDEMKKHVMIVKAARNGLVNGMEVEAYMPITRIISDDRTNFSKSPTVIATIGSETLCCFRKGGAAQALLDPAIKSPISGILEGRINRNRWFSFIWEMLEIEDGEVRKTLILDNIEANGHISDGSVLWDRLRKIKGYHKIYVGYMRNDMTFEPGVKDVQKPRQFPLVGYEKAFAAYGGYDDSRNVHTVVQNEVDREAVIKRMNQGDLHRAKYLEQYMYEQPDPDFIDIDVTASPSYIIESYSHIYGYFTTRLKYYDKSEPNHKYAQKQDIAGKALKEWKKKKKEDELDEVDGLEKVLYLEDILILPYRKCKLAMKDAFEDLIKWAQENGIETIAANTNEDSKPFVKRIKEAGFKYVEQKDMSGFKAKKFDANPDVEPTVVESRL